jgi:hypothetical protein
MVEMEGTQEDNMEEEELVDGILGSPRVEKKKHEARINVSFLYKIYDNF